MPLTPKEVQEMLGVPDEEIIAHGYTLERDTVDLYFRDGLLVRNVNGVEQTSETFRIDPHNGFYPDGIKRWYKDRTNPRLISLCETFGRELPLTW